MSAFLLVKHSWRGVFSGPFRDADDIEIISSRVACMSYKRQSLSSPNLQFTSFSQLFRSTISIMHLSTFTVLALGLFSGASALSLRSNDADTNVNVDANVDLKLGSDLYKAHDEYDEYNKRSPSVLSAATAASAADLPTLPTDVITSIVTNLTTTLNGLVPGLGAYLTSCFWGLSTKLSFKSPDWRAAIWVLPQLFPALSARFKTPPRNYKVSRQVLTLKRPRTQTLPNSRTHLSLSRVSLISSQLLSCVLII